MKLSDIVAYLNLLDSLDVANECNTATAKLNHINHVVTDRSEQPYGSSQAITSTFNELVNNITKFSGQIETLKRDLLAEICHLEQEYLQNSLTVYSEEMIHDRDRKSTRLNSSHVKRSRMPSSA